MFLIFVEALDIITKKAKCCALVSSRFVTAAISGILEKEKNRQIFYFYTSHIFLIGKAKNLLFLTDTHQFFFLYSFAFLILFQNH